ncbi:MAG: hypothetical protein ACIAQF_00915 [Phycisphaerales bacterium JB065]
MATKSDPNPSDDRPMSAMERYAAMREQADKPKDNLTAYIRKPGGKRPPSESGYNKRVPERAEYPRRVRAGLKVGADQWPPHPLSAFAAPFVGAVNATFTDSVITEAFRDYAQRGQTRAFKIAVGMIQAEVQGRRFKAYETTIALDQVEMEQWEKVIDALVSDPLLNARLLSGEFPKEIDAVFQQHGASLAPAEGETITVTCDCKEEKPCKHGACLAMLLTEAVQADPFILLDLRGLARDHVLERLRQRRAVTSSSTGLVPAFSPTPPSEVAESEAPIETTAASFWDAGAELRDIEIPIKKPEISYPLLRRLGPSPFEEGKFPLVGLLATCYELISEEALRLESEPESNDAG